MQDINICDARGSCDANGSCDACGSCDAHFEINMAIGQWTTSENPQIPNIAGEKLIFQTALPLAYLIIWTELQCFFVREISDLTVSAVPGQTTMA
jgi:hypothetical protein